MNRPVPEPLPRRRQRGVTLVELVIAMVIIGLAVGGVMQAFQQAVRGSSSPLYAKQSLAIAEALLEEVQLAPFTYCTPLDPKYAANPAFVAASTADCTSGYIQGLGPEAGDTRPFDNVGDYNGLSLSPITDVTGTTYPGLASGYSAKVTVANAALNTVPAADSLHITVTVKAPDGESFSLEGYRARYAPNAMP